MLPENPEKVQKSRRRLRLALIIGGAALVALVVFVVAGFEITSSPEFCASCHNMRPYVESWRASTHKDVNCSVCHYPPGFMNYVKGKITDGQAHLVIFITGKARGRYHAEISDSSCLQCHPRESLQAPKEFKGINFSHPNHLDQMRRNKKLRCVTCHGQIVQGEHLTVDVRDCLICHFKADEKGERDPVLSNCRTCHKEVPKEINIGGHTFYHGRYFEEGADCRTCHVGIVSGTGKVDYDRCMECHSEKEKTLKEMVQTKYTTESYHLNHVTNHKVECWRCHAIIKHEMVRNPTSVDFGKNCTVCHSDNQHIGPREMYRGVGGIGVPDSPSKMFLANVDCASCHVKNVEGRYGNHATDVAYLDMGNACNGCHGEGYDSMLHHWKKILGEAELAAGKPLLDAEQQLFSMQKAGGGGETYQQAARLISDAHHNVEFVKVGKGHHNIEYALKLLQAARTMTDEAMGLLKKNYNPKPLPALDMSCTALCHSELETRVVKLGSVNYPHKKHVTDLGFKCTECHGDMDHHGEVHLTFCNDCHHGEGKGKVGCKDCHQNVANLIAGAGANRAVSAPDKMNSQIECVDCHTQVKAGESTTLEGVRKNCASCHDAAYGKKLEDWTAALKKEASGLTAGIEALRRVVAKGQNRDENVNRLANLLLMIDENMALISGNKGLHNLEYAKRTIEASKALLAEAENLLQQHHRTMTEEIRATMPKPKAKTPAAN